MPASEPSLSNVVRPLSSKGLAAVDVSIKSVRGAYHRFAPVGYERA